MAAIPLTQTGPEDGGNFEFQWQGPYLNAHILTDVGRKRQRNEDSCAICAPEDKAKSDTLGRLFAVADGMGGVHGGEFASRLALNTIVENYFSGPGGNIPTRLRDAVHAANRRIFEEAEHNPNYRGMGTTLSAALVFGDYVYVAHVGDSRIYLKRQNHRTVQLTQDHSLVAEQVRSGIITEEEARTHAMKNLITRAVGTKDTVKVDLLACQIEKGDTLMLCSDGLCTVVHDDDIDEALGKSSLQGMCRILVGKALDGGGPDNITVVALRIADQPPAEPLHEGATRVRLNSKGFFEKLFGRLRS